MSKRTTSNNKRKASKVLVTTTSAFAHEGAALLKQPRYFASKMLSLLPQEATLKDKDAKNLLKTFDLVKAGLQQRTNLLSESSVETGAACDVRMCGIAVPPDAYLQVLDYLPRHEVVHKASFVCKAWFAHSRAPSFWRTLDSGNGLLQLSTTITNMDSLLKLLNRPQFASLKSLTLPEKICMRKKAMEQIYKACPMLEEIDLGYSRCSNMKPDDAALLSLVSVFPRLTKLSLSLRKVTDPGVAAFCENMGDRLVSIRIQANRQALSDTTLKVIGRCCPNLECFDYSDSVSKTNGVTDEGILALLRGCAGLKNLMLDVNNTYGVGLDAFEHILEDDATKVDHLLVVGHEELMYEHALCEGLANKLVYFEAISDDEHISRIVDLRESRQSHLYYR